MADGSRLEGQTLIGWHDRQSTPMLDGRPLLDPARPFLWLRDRSLRAESMPDAFIEMIGGDRLPGEVVSYRKGAEGYEPAPAHLLVRVPAEFRGGIASPGEELRVVERFVRRVVWQRRELDRYQPGQAFFRDGRSIAYRALRWVDNAVQLLTDEGQRKVLFTELAEIHLPLADPWQAWLDEVSILSPSGVTPLYQVVTTNGLTATASLERLLPQVDGNPREPERWHHFLQPAWSLDLLRVPGSVTMMRRLLSPRSIPLTRLPWQMAAAGGILGGQYWQPRVDLSVQGGPLAAGGWEGGWGFGAHAPARIVIPLPPWPSKFVGQAGLDPSVGIGGGCVRVRIRREQGNAAPLFESPYLVGGAATAEIAPIDLPADLTGKDGLVLEVDAAHSGRPAGADPLDIRDLTNWLEPALIWNPEATAPKIRERVMHQMPAWQGWTLQGESDGAWSFVNLPEEERPRMPPIFRLAVAASQKPLILRREIQVRPEDRYLVIAAYAAKAGPPSTKIEVRVDGESVVEEEVSDLQRRDTAPPIVVSMLPFVGHKVKVEVVQSVGSVPVDWRSLRMSEQLPTLFSIWEDSGEATPLGDGQASVVNEGAYSGKASLKIPKDARFRVSASQSIPIRQQPNWGEYRYLRFAFRKSGQGRVCIEVEHAKGREKVVRYDAGTGPPTLGEAKRVWALDLPHEWIVMTVDLYQDFGPLDVSGLILSAPDGEFALIDQLYLGRSDRDFERLPAAASPEATNRKARTELAKQVLDRALPATVALQAGDRWASGTMIEKSGLVLTAGHFVATPGKEVKVYLADGKTAEGKMLGVYRYGDVGLVQLSGSGPWTATELGGSKELLAEQLFLGVAHIPGYTAGKRPEAHITELQRDFREFIWASFDLPNYLAGGGLFDREGKLIGVNSRRSRFNGFLYLKSDLIRENLERMKRSEIWGEWYPGTGPMLGVVVDATVSGCKVKEVLKIAAAGEAMWLKPDDLIQRVEGKSVVSLDDIAVAVAEKNPGDEVMLDVLRGIEKIQRKLKLYHRVP